MISPQGHERPLRGEGQPEDRSVVVGNEEQPGWFLLVYRMPTEPSRARVSVWRELKRLGALYLQQAVCVLPAVPATAARVTAVRRKIVDLGGSHDLFELGALPPDQEADLRRRFRELSSREYDEIVEECQTKFVKEIEFERSRGNYTFEEAEEIRQDLEKIRRWFAKVRQRDWFEAEGRDRVERWLARCEELLDAFEEDVYELTGGRDPRPG